MKENKTHKISLFGNVEAEELSLLEKIRDHLVSKGIPEHSIHVPFDVLILLDNQNVYISISLSNVSPEGAKLYFEDFRNLKELTEESVITLSREKYNFKTPHVFSFDKDILAVRHEILSVFRKYEGVLDQNKCFVLMPFSKKMDEVYDQIIAVFDELKEQRLSCLRADKSTKPEVITEYIWQQINESYFLIADLTGRNPNVYYEVGLAHSLGKPVIMITQEPAVPFDLRNIRCLRYSLKDNSSRDHFRKSLKAAILELVELLDTLSRIPTKKTNPG